MYSIVADAVHLKLPWHFNLINIQFTIPTWGFRKIGLLPVIIHFRLGLSLTSTIHLGVLPWKPPYQHSPHPPASLVTTPQASPSTRPWRFHGFPPQPPRPRAWPRLQPGRWAWDHQKWGGGGEKCGFHRPK